MYSVHKYKLSTCVHNIKYMYMYMYMCMFCTHNHSSTFAWPGLVPIVHIWDRTSSHALLI